LPKLPVLPKEAIAAGAKWQVTSTGKLAEQLEVTYTTEYQLVTRKGNTATIKGTTKVTGIDKTIETPAQGQNPSVKTVMSKIKGFGSLDATLIDGALYPALKSEVLTGFSVSVTAANNAAQEGTLEMKQAATITPKS